MTITIRVFVWRTSYQFVYTTVADTAFYVLDND